ncbi:hypothetical protein SKAU_G00080940 [Synaphobranchus kaupii]|uniref:Uncharacterized protein n=1 Tax=Synaphobranchus kaupii TaxID=118154 RepID=A0A9Q1FUT6_SYNKA|nr:hypothetical protein SKAU_G00080940 [Synaphobranchus kaupii]
MNEFTPSHYPLSHKPPALCISPTTEVPRISGSQTSEAAPGGPSGDITTRKRCMFCLTVLVRGDLRPQTAFFMFRLEMCSSPLELSLVGRVDGGELSSVSCALVGARDAAGPQCTLADLAATCRGWSISPLPD